VLTQVTATVRTRELLEPGDLVLASVSGGPDSLCLLYSLWYLRRLLKIRVEVFHFDHRLREGSSADAEYVRRTSARLHRPERTRVRPGRTLLVGVPGCPRVRRCARAPRV